MASLSYARRLTVRLSAQKLSQNAIYRGLRTSTASLVAQNLTMPALSPTMMEGNIAKWNVKEGDSFSAGDVLLQIETDKASMDVEAQDDGIMAKIILGDDSKGIKVGTRIGVLADVEDDLSKLDLSNEASITTNSSKESSDVKPESNNQVNNSAISGSNLESQPDSAHSSGRKQTYPLLPSVQHLMRLHNIDYSQIEKMIPSGPNNRLLKGDVLAFLGQVSKSYPTQLSGKISNLTHLDLSNIKIKAPMIAIPKITKTTETLAPEPKATVILEQPISFENIYDIQKKMKSILGASLSEEKLISRATYIANENLPRPKSYKATKNDLFDAVLGINTKSITQSQLFTPTLLTPPILPAPNSKKESPTRIDIIDILSGKKRPNSNSNHKKGIESMHKIFKLEVEKNDEEIAKCFLSKLKTTLESQPGNLIF
ncbi:putative pyruvate dehydrogenase protein X component, mitochondrial [Erysiphe neolycopersici]|uniref:Putative pyruvate dehydrogenase protein X component, mitochondrial n=1 Tax=Erysiphe neolycopersici TaxID=212602 RepID=A0A420HTV5_9PEZI|nr:putative pyruvate dehydrogenase protein X component, mitochondrial [Erysiphe neolycopersici]